MPTTILRKLRPIYYLGVLFHRPSCWISIQVGPGHPKVYQGKNLRGLLVLNISTVWIIYASLNQQYQSAEGICYLEYEKNNNKWYRLHNIYSAVLLFCVAVALRPGLLVY